MNEYTEIEQFDTSVLEDSYYSEELDYVDPSEIADDFFSDLGNMPVEEIALECSRLMDAIEAEGGAHSSDGGDPRMVRIMALANYLAWFYPEHLDPRFQ